MGIKARSPSVQKTRCPGQVKASDRPFCLGTFRVVSIPGRIRYWSSLPNAETAVVKGNGTPFLEKRSTGLTVAAARHHLPGRGRGQRDLSVPGTRRAGPGAPLRARPPLAGRARGAPAPRPAPGGCAPYARPRSGLHGEEGRPSLPCCPRRGPSFLPSFLPFPPLPSSPWRAPGPAPRARRPSWPGGGGGASTLRARARARDHRTPFPGRGARAPRALPPPPAPGPAAPPSQLPVSSAGGKFPPFRTGMEAVGKGPRSSWCAAGLGSAWAAASPVAPWEKGRLDRAPPGPQGRRLPGLGARCRRGHGPGRLCLHTRHVIPHTSGFVAAGVRAPALLLLPAAGMAPCGCSAGSSPGDGGLALGKGTPAFCSYENWELPPRAGEEGRILPSFEGS